MNSTLEKITAYILGATGGFVLNSILVAFEVSVFKDPETRIGALTLCICVGVLVSIVYVEYKNQVLLKKNTTIRNETVALISHELRTSLTSSGWVMGLVLKKYESHLEESDKKMLQNIIGSIQTTVMHSVHLLDVSLLDIKKIAISLEWVTLDKVELMFNEVIEKYTVGAKEHQVELEASVVLDYKRMVEVD